MYRVLYHLFSRLLAGPVASMGSNILVVALAIVAMAIADPYAELKSNFEFLDAAEAFTNLAEPKYRLRDTVQPITMDVDLDVYLDESRFTGLVQIGVDIQERLSQIVLHQNVVSITGVSVLCSNGQPIPLQNPNPFETDSYYEILKINLNQVIEAGSYTLIISYLGQINENPIDRGFYKGYYYFNDVKRYYATTQFQPYHARKAFPCFDEPQFKSVYTFSITRDSSLSQSYSNMAIYNTQTVAINRIKETFRPTPIISAYLTAFHVSAFEESVETGTVAKPFGIIAREGVLSQHVYASIIGVNITQVLDDYLDYEYYSMGQGQPMKNDHIALPDFPSGAMENWGMVNYREAYLLYDPENTNLVNKIFIATIIAHEMAHKWFGNLVTCFWWSNLWLNESYASFFEYFAAHLADTTLELDDQFVVDYVHSALAWDSGAGATSMNWTNVADNPSISSHFSTTSYAKGASVLRMMEHFVGTDNFKAALQNYIRDNAYGLGTPELMYAGFRQAVASDATFAETYPNIDVGEVFDSWVQNRGSPVLNVDYNMNTGVITLTQERYQLTGNIPSTLWQIPVTWTHGSDPNFNNLRPNFVMTERRRVIQGPIGHDWVIFNLAQSGLYRVNYDDHNWQHIASDLRGSARETIHKLSRAQIVNDILYFIRGGHISIFRAIDVLSFLQVETDYYVWAAALGQLDWIRRRLEHLPTAHTVYSNWLSHLMDHVIEEIGYDEGLEDSTSLILNRMQILNYACNNLGHQGCIDYSRQRWQEYKDNDNNLVPVNARRYVYCVGLREGDASDYQFLFEKYNTSQNTADMVVILRALACTKDSVSLDHYLEQSLYNDKIRIHDKTNAFSFAVQGNPENLRPVLQFLYRDYKLIVDHYGGADRLNIALNALTASFTNFSEIVEFQEWLYRNQLDLPDSFSTGVGVIGSAISNLEWGNDIATDLVSEIRHNLSLSSATSVTVSIAVLLAATLTQLLK